uniref:ATP-dependent DNA helicase PIF1 n=1 Tax=Caenorhabditis japonica TaxID=281687 RepID=A0A8R1HMM7_CAEJA
MSKNIEEAGVSESPSNCTYCYTLDCSLRIESTSSSKKTAPITAKKALLTVGRNSQRQILLQIEIKTKTSGQPAAVCYDATDAIVHLQNVANGKCTVEIPSKTIMLQLLDCAPRKLNVFMKSLQAKLDIMRMENGTIQVVPKPISRLPAAFSVLSPLTIGEMRKVKKMREPLSITNSNGKQVTTPKRRSSSTMLIPGGLENRILSRSIGLKRMTSFARDDREKTEFTSLKPIKEDNTTVLERIQLTEEQKNVVRSVINTKKSIFFTGSAGTGKSVILRRIIEMLPATSTYVTAATGVAASQIGGITLHGFCGFLPQSSSAEQCVQQVLNQNQMVRQWKRCAHLIIDEISMVDSEFFEKLEYVARCVRNNSLPFGGIQLIITGDFLQLPPVSKEEPVFCFESQAWYRCIQKTIVLNNVKRQDDDVFVKILNKVRVGICDFKSADLLKQSAKHQFPPNVIPTRLCTHSDDAERINRRNLLNTKGDEKTFHAHDDDNFDSSFRTLAVKKLTLKVGSQVMLIKNIDVNKGLCNGSRGYVEKFSDNGNPLVRFVSQKHTSIEIRRSKFSVRIPGCDTTAIRRQLPLQLAWAISIHKSQGLTLDCAEISLERVFADGQAYVALSRARSLSSIRILEFDASCVRANSKVIQYYKSIEDDNEEEDNYLESDCQPKKFKPSNF